MTTQLEIVKLVDGKIVESLKRIRLSGGSYWTKISAFQVVKDGKKWRAVDAYDVASNYQKCELCGHFPCRYLYVIESETGEKLTIGSECVLNYVKDINAREILRRFQTNVITKVMVVQTSRKTLIKVAEWVNANGPKLFLSSITRQLLAGKKLSKDQSTMVDKILQTSVDSEAKTQVVVLIKSAGQKVRNNWENRFMISVRDQFSQGRDLSEKQLVIVRRIANY